MSVTLDKVKRLQSLWWPSFVFQQRESVHRGRPRGSGVTHWSKDTFSKASFNLMEDFSFLPLRDLNNPEEKTGPLNSNRFQKLKLSASIQQIKTEDKASAPQPFLNIYNPPGYNFDVCRLRCSPPLSEEPP